MEPDISIMGEKHYSISRFASCLGISKSTLERWVKNGKGPEFWKLGRTSLVSPQAAEKFYRKLKGE